MKVYFVLLTIILVSCSKHYKSPYGYDIIKLYKYNGKPWDTDASNNKLYNSYNSEKALYFKIRELNYSLKESFKANAEIDSILFTKNHEKYRPRPKCPVGFNHILLLYKDSKLKYIVKFNEYCEECFLIDSKNDFYYLKMGYDDFIKLVEIQ